MYLVSLTDSNAINEIYFVELVQAGGKVKVNLWKIVAKTDSWIWLVFGNKIDGQELTSIKMAFVILLLGL